MTYETNIHYLKEGTPKSKTVRLYRTHLHIFFAITNLNIYFFASLFFFQYPSCQSAPDKAEVHVTSYKGTVETFLADDITGQQLCQGKDDGKPIPKTCAASEYKDPNCLSQDGSAPPVSTWTNVEMTSSSFKKKFDIHDEKSLTKPRPHTKPITDPASTWSTGDGWTKCAAENTHRLQKDTCPRGYCAADHRNASKVPWACCSKCPGGTKQCLDNCECRCTKKCTAPDPTPPEGGKCNCGNEADVRYGNGNDWSPAKVMNGLFTCNAQTFGATSPNPVPQNQAHCECDQSESIQESSGHGSGYAQCTNYGIGKSSGTLAIFNGDGTQDLENYQFQVDILHGGAFRNSAGVVFRYQDSKNYYRVVVTSWCTSLIRVLNGVQTRITSKYHSSGKLYCIVVMLSMFC